MSDRFSLLALIVFEEEKKNKKKKEKKNVANITLICIFVMQMYENCFLFFFLYL